MKLHNKKIINYWKLIVGGVATSLLTTCGIASSITLNQTNLNINQSHSSYHQNNLNANDVNTIGTAADASVFFDGDGDVTGTVYYTIDNTTEVTIVTGTETSSATKNFVSGHNLSLKKDFTIGETPNCNVVAIEDYAFYDNSDITGNIDLSNFSGTNLSGTYVFASCQGISSVTLPADLTNIGSAYFFYCQNMLSVTFPATIQSIGTYAFQCCTHLNRVDMSKCINLSSIGNFAFQACNINDIKFPSDGENTTYQLYNFNNSGYAITPASTLASNIWTNNSKVVAGLAYGNIDMSQITAESFTSISAQCFFSCYGINKLILPDQVATINRYAFSGCKNLSDVTIGSGCTTISTDTTNFSAGAFEGCGIQKISVNTGNTNFTTINIGDNGIALVYKTTGKWTAASVALGNGLICGDLDFTGTDENVTSLASHCCYRCNGVKSVKFGNELQEIGEYAFACCINLTAVDFMEIQPTNFTSIGLNAFAYCDLQNIDFPKNNPYYWTYQLGENGEAIVRPQDLDQDGQWTSTTTVSATGCLGCGDLDFSNCTNLTHIAAGAFDCCVGITSVKLPEQIDSIGSGAFYNCFNLSSAIFPTSLSEVSSQAFDGALLKKVIFENTNPQWMTGLASDWIGDGLSKNFQLSRPYLDIEVPKEAINDYEYIFTYQSDLCPWYDSHIMGLIIPIPTPTSDSVDKFFYNNDGSHISGTLCYIDNGSNLTILPTTGSEYTNIEGNNLILDPQVIGKINEPISCISSQAFLNNEKLTGSLTLPSSITSIGANAFNGCTNLQIIDLRNYSDIPSDFATGCFSGCPANILIPYTTNLAKLSAWYSVIAKWTGTTNPKENIVGSATDWAKNVKSGDFEVQVDQPDASKFTLVSGTNVIANDLALNTNIIAIGDEAFKNNNTLLGSVYIPSTVTTIGDNVFDGCSALTEISLNWDPSIFKNSNQIDISHTWLGTLNKSGFTILVPVGTVEAYTQVATDWGMWKCTITDGTVPVEDNDDSLPLILGLSIGLGVPTLAAIIGLIIYGTKNYQSNHPNKTKKS